MKNISSVKYSSLDQNFDVRDRGVLNESNEKYLLRLQVLLTKNLKIEA